MLKSTAGSNDPQNRHKVGTQEQQTEKTTSVPFFKPIDQELERLRRSQRQLIESGEEEIAQESELNQMIRNDPERFVRFEEQPVPDGETELPPIPSSPL